MTMPPDHAFAVGYSAAHKEVDDDEKGFVASGELNPAKSRALLQLALTKTRDPVRVQKMFYKY
jgi:L-asparaginase